MDVNTQPVANGSMNLPPALRDAVANASYNYDEALIAYEDALASRDTGKRSLAEARLHDAAARLSAAQSALVSSHVSVPAKPSFADLLADPRQQLDPTGEVMRSVLAYRTAPVATASATPTWAGDRGPGGPGRRAGRGDGAGGDLTLFRADGRVVRTCHAVADDRYLSPLVRCDGCGRDYDTDASATALMLARAVAPDSPDEGALATA